MGFFDRFLDAIRLNDDYDDDEFYDEEDDDFEDDDVDYDDYEEEKPKQRFFDRFTKKSNDDDFDDEEDDFDDDIDDYEESARAARRNMTPSSASSVRQSTTKARREREREKEREKAAKKAKPARNKKGSQSQINLNVIRPSSMEDTKDIADILKESRPVVLNLEGIDIDMAQRIIDFTCGVCYALDGDLKIVSNYIYLITPDGVDTYGDVQSILDGSDFEIPSMRSPY